MKLSGQRRWRVPALVALVAVGALALGACSDDEPAPSGDANAEPTAASDGVVGGAIAQGPGISVTDALASNLDGPLLVNGFIVVDDDAQVRLCEGLLESSPPQCGSPSLLVENFDLDSIGPTASAIADYPGGPRTVTWTEQTVQVLGTVNGGVLTVATTPAAASDGVVAGPSAMGPGISVTDALASDLDGPLLVNGYIIVDDGGQRVRLCEGLLESGPPQCGSPSLLVANIDLDSVGALDSAIPVDGGIQTVSWTDHTVQLLGTVDGGTLTIATSSIAIGPPPPSATQ